MLEDKFTIFDATSKGASGVLGLSLDSISSIPNIIYLIGLGCIIVVFIGLLFVFGGRLKWAVRHYF